MLPKRIGSLARPADAARAFVGRLERVEALDGPAAAVQRVARGAGERLPEAKDLLSGTWLGHPLHPPLTDIVIGAWTGAIFLDVCGGHRGREAADRLLGLGIAASVPTAAAGISDWAELRGGERRIGAAHALGNALALSAQFASLTARRRGARRFGVALSLCAVGVAGAAAWLGGHLSLARAVGVNNAALEPLPDEWTAVLAEDAVTEGELTAAWAGGVQVVLARWGGRVHALAGRCTHRGCSLDEGRLVAATIVCPCHGSTFRVEDGGIVRGPAVYPQPVLEVRSHAGEIEVRRRR